MVDALSTVRRSEPVEASLHVKNFTTGLFEVERCVLQSNTDTKTNIFRFRNDVVPGNGGRPRCWVQEGGKHAHSGGFARAIGSEESVDLSGLDGEVNSIDCEIVTEGASEIGRGDGVGHLPNAIGVGPWGSFAVVRRFVQYECEQGGEP